MVVCNGEVASLLTYFTDEITLTVTEILVITVYGCQIIGVNVAYAIVTCLLVGLRVSTVLAMSPLLVFSPS